MTLEIPIKVVGLQKTLEDIRTAKAAEKAAQAQSAAYWQARIRAQEQAARAAERAAAQTTKAAEKSAQAQVRAAQQAARQQDQIRNKQNQANAAYWLAQMRDAEKANRSTAIQPGARLALGPHQLAQQAAENLAAARRNGTPSQIRDAEILNERRQKSLAKAEKPDSNRLQKALSTAIRSTRFEVNDGKFSAMPLVGRSMDVLAAMGPLGEAAGVATAGLIAIGAAASSAAQMVNAETQARFTSGGTAMEQSRLGAAGNALGLSSQDMASLSRQFASARQSDPFTQATFGYDRSDAYGRTDKAGELLKAIDQLRAMSNDQAIRAARSAGLEQLLPMRLLSQQSMSNLRSDADIRSQVVDRDYQAKAIELSTATGRLSDAFSNLLESGVKPLMGPLGQLANSIAGGVNEAVSSSQTSQNVADMYQRRSDQAYKNNDIKGRIYNEAGAIKAFFGIYGENPQDASKIAAEANREAAMATDKNTQATMQNTAAVMASLGAHGGGPLARGAIPAAWFSAAMNMDPGQVKESQRLAMGMGAFGN